MLESWFEKAYRARQKAALRKVHALGLKVSWIASEIGRVRPWTSAVLNGSRYGEETLALVEDLIRRVEAGELAVPREGRSKGNGRGRKRRKRRWWQVLIGWGL